MPAHGHPVTVAARGNEKRQAIKHVYLAVGLVTFTQYDGPPSRPYDLFDHRDDPLSSQIASYPFPNFS
jgi:hypothetical protein